MLKPSDSVSVSIGIPTYNRADGYLQQALKSAVAQDYHPLEIIVSDNCSSDHTESVVRSFEDTRIRYFRQKKNVEANANFNACLEKATGDYFLLLHDDDVLDEDFVTTCMKAADGNKDTGVIITGTRVIDGDGNVIKENQNRVDSGATFHEFVSGWFEHRVALYLCSTLYNTRYLKKLNGFHSPHDLYQDVVATVQLAALYGQIHCRQVKASFRLHGSNRGDSAGVMNWCEDCVYLLDLISGLLADNKKDIEDLAHVFFSRQCYGFALNIQNLPVRLYTYHKIYKAFRYSYSPRKLIRKNEVPRIKAAIRSIRRAVAA